MKRACNYASEQVFQKDYAAKFALSGKPVTAIGVNFSSSTKGVEGWKRQEVDFLSRDEK